MIAQAMIMPKKYFFDSNGDPLAFGKIYTYQAGTTNNKETFTTEKGDVANTNPIILNGEGYASIYINGSYNIVVDDLNDINIWTEDNVSSNIAEEWVNCETPIYISSASFKITGDVTEQYEFGRRVQINNNVLPLEYSTIKTSSFAAGETTITVTDPIVAVGIIGVCVSIIGKNSTIGEAVIPEDTVLTMTANTKKIYVIGDVAMTLDFLAGKGGGGTYDVIATGTIPFLDLPNAANIIVGTADPSISFVLRVFNGQTTASSFGCVEDGVTDDTSCLSIFLVYIYDNNVTGILKASDHLVSGILFNKSNPGSFNLKTMAGQATITYSGSHTDRLIFVSDRLVSAKVENITFECASLISQPLRLDSLQANNGGHVELRNVIVKNVHGQIAQTAIGLTVIGSFDTVDVIGCEIDGITRITPANACQGIAISGFTGRARVLSNKVSNITSPNPVVDPDADGIVIFGASGALVTDRLTAQSIIENNEIENCVGRFIKSQMSNTVVKHNVLKLTGLTTTIVDFAGVDLQSGNGMIFDNTIIIESGVTLGTGAILFACQNNRDDTDEVSFVLNNRVHADVDLPSFTAIFAKFKGNSFHILDNVISGLGLVKKFVSHGFSSGATITDLDSVFISIKGNKVPLGAGRSLYDPQGNANVDWGLKMFLEVYGNENTEYLTPPAVTAADVVDQNQAIFAVDRFKIGQNINTTRRINWVFDMDNLDAGCSFRTGGQVVANRGTGIATFFHVITSDLYQKNISSDGVTIVERVGDDGVVWKAWV